MTWQAITEEESVPVVKAGDALVSNFSKLKSVINFIPTTRAKSVNVCFQTVERYVFGM
jgi:hypothetical protein